jgi:membrane dipeptidase
MPISVRTILGLTCLSLIAALGSSPPIDTNDISKRAHDLHFSSVVLDTHDDTTTRLMGQHFDVRIRHHDGSIDIPRMQQGGLNGIFFAIYIPGTITGSEAVKAAIDHIDAVHEMVRANPKEMNFCVTAEEVRRAHRDGKIAVLMGVEGGHMIANDLGVLRTYSQLGIRYLTLTHSVNDEWADSSTDKPIHNGLTEFGKDVVREMNRLGMVVDVSHVSDKTFYDALAVSRAPLIASHSSCRAICDAPRNMTDDMIRALAAKGGVIQINYSVSFLSQDFLNALRAHPELEVEIAKKVQERCGDTEGCEMVEKDKLIREYVAQGKLPRVEWTQIVDHIDHVAKLVGADHVGLGSDFDGASMPYGMEDASQLPKITDALLTRGYSETDVQKILGGNALRVMDEVEATAERLRRAE